MPAAPGATPRKMLPPPMTMPISTPRRDTCATSATMFSIVCRLMPNGSSPISASPDSFSRIRLYLGVTAAASMRSAGLRHHFGGEIGALLLDPLADDEEDVAMDLRLARREHLFHRLLVVLDEGLAKERFLAKELVDGALGHLCGDFRRLAGFLGARLLDATLIGDHLLRDLASAQIDRPGEGNMHGKVLARILRPVKVDQHANLASMHIEGEPALRLQALEAPQGDVLPDLLHQRLAARLDLRAEHIDRTELLEVRRRARGDDLGERFGEGDEIVVLGDEIGL